MEKRLLELEGKTRHDVGRAGLEERIWQWKDRYQKRIVRQQQSMGCSCDWDRQRFTMDAVCAHAVRRTFFAMFRDGLIFRGHRLVNWDCQLQTAVADDEIVHEAVQGWFYYLRYPVVEPRPGEPAHVVVATTRPETMLGDTAVACHPDPAGVLATRIAETRRRLQQAPPREHPALAAELARLEARRAGRLPTLLALARMAREGRQVRLPLLGRCMPLICDEWARPELGSGCVKITPAHDPNDYEVWTRHRQRIDRINILNADGTLNANAGPYAGLDRFAARERVVADLEAGGLLEAREARDIEIGHSDRSKTPIEPYLSRQWFVRMGDVDGGIVCGRGTPNAFAAPGLAQAAMDAAQGAWRSPTGRGVSFHPDAVRYGNTYLQWLGEKRDWCISRQLWWGHRIPVWSGTFAAGAVPDVVKAFRPHLGRGDLCLRLVDAGGASAVLTGPDDAGGWRESFAAGEVEVMACLRDLEADGDLAQLCAEQGLTQDPDVLDTWFSSGLWPQSTLGWPDPATARVEAGQPAMGGRGGFPDTLSYYYPGSCLVTGRDIITLWVARMVVMGLYNLGDVPFTDVFIHANILDGKGERMSKSKGNGIDPVDIIERYGADAMRYVLCDMQTGTQDIRLPVQAISPFTGNLIDLAAARHGRSIFTYVCPETGKEFDVLGTMPDVPAAKLVSERFEAGRQFCNKLLNAVRFALMNLAGAAFRPLQPADLAVEDRWILSRLARAVEAVHGHLAAYNPAAALWTARDFFWNELCDWYLELVKPRLRDADRAGAAQQVVAVAVDHDRAGAAQQVVAVAVDHVLRLFHPFVPYLTERLWEALNERAPRRGVEEPLAVSPLLIRAQWPAPKAAWRDDDAEAQIAFLQDVVRAVRDVRSRYAMPPQARIAARIRAAGADAGTLRGVSGLLVSMARLEAVEIGPDVRRTADAATAVVGGVEVYVPGAVDIEKERDRLTRQRDQLLGRMAGSRRKLGNERFLDKASPEVVRKERERLAACEEEMATIESALAGLG